LRRGFCRRRRLIVLLIAVLSAGAVSSGVFGQQQAGPVSRVDLGMGQAAPGAKVSIPAILKAPDSVNVGAVLIEIAFPSGMLTFVEATKAIAAEAANAKVSAVARPAEAQSSTTIVDISVVAEKGVFIPNGSMLDLFFQVSPKAPMKETITVGTSAEILTTAEPPVKLPAIGDTGEIIIAETTLTFACFFYMH
jgi:hypothetical protein